MNINCILFASSLLLLKLSSSKGSNKWIKGIIFRLQQLLEAAGYIILYIQTDRKGTLIVSHTQLLNYLYD